MSAGADPNPSSDPSADAPTAAMTPPAEAAAGADRRYFSTEYETGYRPMSILAVLALVLSVVSLVAFISPFFFFVPFVVLLLAVYASRQAETARTEIAGQLPAKLAILISLMILVAAPTRHYIERAIITAEARRFANAFVDAVLIGDAKQAYAYTLHPVRREGLEGEALDENLTRAGAEYRNYLRDPFVNGFLGQLAASQVTEEGYDGYDYAEGMYEVVYAYEIARDNQPNIKLYLVLKGGTGTWEGRQWYVEQYSPQQMAVGT